MEYSSGGFESPRTDGWQGRGEKRMGERGLGGLESIELSDLSHVMRWTGRIQRGL